MSPVRLRTLADIAPDRQSILIADKDIAHPKRLQSLQWRFCDRRSLQITVSWLCVSRVNEYSQQESQPRNGDGYEQHKIEDDDEDARKQTSRSPPGRMNEVGNAERSDDDVGCIADDENEQYRYDPRCPYRHAVRRGHVDAADISQDVVLVGNEGTRPRNRMDRKAARPGVYFVSGRESRGHGAGRGGAGRIGKQRVGVRSGRSWLSETHATRNFFHPR